MSKTPNNLHTLFRVLLLTVAASFIYAVSSGIRNNYGIMLDSIMHNAGISFASISFVLAIGQLVYGVVQPVFGILAGKKGNLVTLVIGVLLIVSGLLLIPQCKSVLSLTVCLGLILPAGTGAIAFGIIMGTITPKLPASIASTISGIVNASSGIGNTIMSPVINGLILTGGLAHGMYMLAIPAALMLPFSLFIAYNRARPSQKKLPQEDSTAKISIGKLFRIAFRHRTYIFLMVGFFTCGFHMALITNHLPTEFTSYGYSAETTAYVFSIYGIATIVGSLCSGTACGKMKMEKVLGFMYGLRPVSILAFLLLPKTMVVITGFTIFLGFSGASTVPPVSGLVGKIFGAKNMATLFGFVFLVHQIGGFLGAWLGGICFDTFGSYTTIWIADLILSAIASLVSFAIRDTNAVSYT